MLYGVVFEQNSWRSKYTHAAVLIVEADSESAAKEKALRYLDERGIILSEDELDWEYDVVVTPIKLRDGVFPVYYYDYD